MLLNLDIWSVRCAYFLLGIRRRSDGTISAFWARATAAAACSSCVTLYSTTKNSPFIILTVAGHQPLASSSELPSLSTSHSSPAFSVTPPPPPVDGSRVSTNEKRNTFELHLEQNNQEFSHESTVLLRSGSSTQQEEKAEQKCWEKENQKKFLHTINTYASIK